MEENGLIKNVKPCIIAEKYMEDSISKDIKDYKFFVSMVPWNFLI